MSTVIAHEILDQLGGRRFTTMTGAKNLCADGPSLSFRLPNNFAADGINYVRVELNAMDTYDMTFERIYRHEVKSTATHKGLYCDMLQKTFTEVTGLSTRL